MGTQTVHIEQFEKSGVAGVGGAGNNVTGDTDPERTHGCYSVKFLPEAPQLLQSRADTINVLHVPCLFPREMPRPKNLSSQEIQKFPLRPDVSAGPPELDGGL